MAVLDLERTWWMQDGQKDTLIRERFACSTDEYYLLLSRLIENPDALAYDPLVVRRLVRMRDRRRRNRLDDLSGASAELTGEGQVQA
jgi:hypothetical protein